MIKFKGILLITMMVCLISVNHVYAKDSALVNVNSHGRALQGYDAVAFFVEGDAVPGVMKHQSTYEGAIYQFSAAENKQKFDSDPGRYVPQYGGFCAVSMAMGAIEPVSIDTWSVVGEKLYLQRNAKAKGMWKTKGPDMFIMKANNNWPGLEEKFASAITFKQVTASMDLTLEAAKVIAAAGHKYAKEHMAPGGAIAVVDSGGHLLYLERLDGTFPAASRVANEKARTAAMFRFPSKKLEDGILGGRTSLITVGHNMLRGGIPIYFKGQTVGGVGVSGAASADQDVEIATAGSHANFNE